MTTNNPGNAKRWLTSGLTPPGWVSPGPQCTIKNSAGTVPIFVQINRVEAARLRNEDYNVTYDLLNGGTAHPLLGDTTFNIIDSDIVGNYSSSCLSLTDPTCYGRMHSEIDRDWKAAGYCGTGTVCDNATLLQQVKPVSTLIDVQGFVYWDDDHIIDSWHQFNGWELHPITAWKLDNALQPETISFNWSPTNPVVGQPVTFKAQVYGGKPNSVLSWDFGDGGTTISQGSTVSHLYLSRATFTVRVNTLDLQGMTVSDQRRIAVGSWNNAVGCSPVLTSLDLAAVLWVQHAEHC